MPDGDRPGHGMTPDQERAERIRVCELIARVSEVSILVETIEGVPTVDTGTGESNVLLAFKGRLNQTPQEAEVAILVDRDQVDALRVMLAGWAEALDNTPDDPEAWHVIG